MPNHVGSSLMISGSSYEIQRFLAKCFSPDPDRPGQRILDFEKITPSHPTVLALESLPDQIWLNGKILLRRVGVDAEANSRSSRISSTKQLRRMSQDDIRSMLEGGKRDDLDPFCVGTARLILECRCATGCYSPYDWSLRNWGTKCNPLYTEIIEMCPEEMEVRFDTAWSAPLPIFRKLGRMFPELEFSIATTDPDMDWALAGSVKGSYSDFWDADVDEIYESVYGEPRPDPEDEDGDWDET
ncbi:hypothetical protein [Microvirga tunisiensis]|uniref:YubB ferredoxin-like domain-containing protein n=1 Tax=Microvirga tunisiensis TaxID=2108360 RepID=A0A5N7MGM1_9HYPH|nr:hypothetical protein [Microvirga tunisiensis]MPR07797.1 hypothetical protein [Microvirga tunisiensis]MPR26192.1 hypothetical protein [Microvirga tunisiensis]